MLKPSASIGPITLSCVYNVMHMKTGNYKSAIFLPTPLFGLVRILFHIKKVGDVIT